MMSRSSAGLRLTVPRLVPVLIPTSTAVLPVFLIGALFPLLRVDAGLTARDLGMVSVAMFGTSAMLTQPLTGLVRRLAPTTVLFAAGVLSAVALLLLSRAQSPVLVVGASLVAGVGNAIVHPAANAYLASREWSGLTGWNFALKQSAVPAATLVCGLVVPVTLELMVWRKVVAILALLAFGTHVALYRWLAEKLPERPHAQDSQQSVPPGSQRIGRGNLSLVTAAAAAGMASATIVGLFYLDAGKNLGITPTRLGLMLSLMSVAGIAGRLAFGWLVDRHDRDRSGLLVVGCFGTGAAGCLGLASGIPWAFLVGAFLAYSIGWAWTGTVQWRIARTSSGQVARNSAVVMTGTSTGAALGPLAASAVVVGDSFGNAWLLASVFAALAGSLYFLSLDPSERPVGRDGMPA